MRPFKIEKKTRILMTNGSLIVQNAPLGYNNNIYFDNMVSQIYPSELQIIKSIPLIPKPHFRLAFVYFK